MAYKSVRSLSIQEAAYVAGLVDGEGTVTLTRRHANERRHLVVSIANTDRELLDYILSIVAAGKITSKRSISERHTPSFCFSISNRQALALLKQIGPFLRTYNKHRAALALHEYTRLTPRNGKYTASLASERLSFETRFMNLNGRTTNT